MELAQARSKLSDRKLIERAKGILMKERKVSEEQAFVKALAAAEPAQRRQQMVDLYKRVIDGVCDLGFPLSIHLEATYGVNKAAFDTFAELLAYWSPPTID